MGRTESGSTTVGHADTTPMTPREPRDGDGDGATSVTPGARLGRYVLRERLGAGGMGEVYAAYDPELDRKVAVKLLHRQVESGGADRLRREARTMARLSHRNLVAVHDVGEHDGQLFLAMELIEGGTLRGWSRGKPWQDVLRTYLEAGRGLAAAHAAGVIHRDFKPDNVLLGADGRVAVGDFGIARRREQGDEHATRPGGGVADASLTRTGALIGTPRYMAPEQLAGQPADARSDQFAFAVALWEALYDRHPLAVAATDLESLQVAMGAGDTLEVPSGAVPARVGRVLQRALRAAPAERWPTLPALLDDLERALPRRRPWLLFAGAAVVIAAGSAAAVYATQARSARSNAAATVCAGGEEQFDAVWSAERQTALRSAMTGSGLAYAPAVFAAVSDGITTWRQSWLGSRQRACRASAVFHEETAEVGAQRMRCFAHQLARLDATLGQLRRPDPVALRNARAAIAGLDDPGRCERDAAAALDEPVVAPSASALADGAARVIDQADATMSLGRYSAAVPLTEVASVLARAAGSPRAEARALYRAGIARNTAKDSAAGRPYFERARRVADAAGDDELRARAIFELASERYMKEEYDTSLSLLDEADSVLTRLGARQDLRARALGLRGVVEIELGKLDDAIAHGQAAVRLLEEREQPEDGVLARELVRHASAYHRKHDYARAIALQERAVAIYERVHLGDHPSIAEVLANMGGAYILAGRPAEAIPILERSIRIRVTYLGEEHTSLASSLQNLGAAYRQIGKLEEAEASVTRALGLMRKTKDLDYMISGSLSSLGSIKMMRGRPAEAVPLYEESLASAIEHLGGHSLDAGDLHFRLGRALYLSGLDRARARREAVRAKEIFQGLSPRWDAKLADVEAWLKAPDTAATPNFK